MDHPSENVFRTGLPDRDILSRLGPRIEGFVTFQLLSTLFPFYPKLLVELIFVFAASFVLCRVLFQPFSQESTKLS